MEASLAITEEELQRYFELNKLKKEIEEEIKKFKTKFHNHFDDLIGKEQKGEIQRGNYKLQRQIRTSVNYEDNSTVEKLEELNLGDFIIVAKRPDADKLKAAFKLGLVEESIFEECKKEKLTQAIVVKETI
ncbi:hypothetical protein [Virgibacillus oceani]|uniref:Uncharacterized protein n=1 Tax=Virgibacillus oceani TaxID=1479511 RepID=A0A917M2A6_9BACI|nr:hypothetical protein [Virgibacillus oceani]GGG72280.1 hypothetical protein GCM10011398_15790 [Virgibacillus oceani]